VAVYSPAFFVGRTSSAVPTETNVVDRVADWLARYAVVLPKVGSKQSRPLAWWSMALRRHLNVGAISVADVEAAAARVSRIRVNPQRGDTNISGRRTFSVAGTGKAVKS
jgi:hypothetical protein